MSKKLKEKHPDASQVMYAGNCSSCKQPTMVSFTIRGDIEQFDLFGNGGKWERCGFYCENCGWDDKGMRERKE